MLNDYDEVNEFSNDNLQICANLTLIACPTLPSQKAQKTPLKKSRKGGNG